MKKLLIPIVSAVVLLVTGCVSHKIPIQQGNVVEQDDLNQVKPGMTKRQVRFLLGSPLIEDPFRDDRWDYVYSMRKDGKLRDKNRVTLYFENEQLARIEGDMAPDPNAPAKERTNTVVNVEEAAKEKRGVIKRVLGGE